MRLLEPITLRGTTAKNRVMFGPLVTNLGDDDRRFTARHTAFYARRAAGGCGIVVTEGASVHPIDWPYERSPLAERCGDGWADIAEACHAHGAIVIASLDHAGGQGTSAYSQRELWAPSRVPEVNTREVPKWMDSADIAAVVDGFASAARVALDAGLDGVEINAGQHSLVRQFLSGLTNHRGDEWGTDRLLFARQVIGAVRSVAGDAVVGLRMSCDELAPWAGITPEMAPDIAAALVADGIDYVTVVRGSIYSVERTRSDFHEAPAYNRDLCRAVQHAISDTPVFLQGSLDAESAEAALVDGVCTGVEITRAQLADPDLVRHVSESVAVRPCIRCNQTCIVRDGRNPIVTCVVEPTTGHESEDPDWLARTARPRSVVVVGGGVAGLETARIAASRGHQVQIIEQSHELGGSGSLLPHAAPYIAWLEQAAREAGVDIHTGTTTVPDSAAVVVQATGSKFQTLPCEVDDQRKVFDVVDVLRGAPLPDGPIALYDPIGGPIAVALAERLGDRAILVTQDQIAGNELSRTGDLAPANTRLAQRGVTIERRSLLRAVTNDGVVLEDRFTGVRRTVPCAAVVHCGFRLPDEPLDGAVQVGDCVAPRTILEAVLEARRVALSI